MTKEGIKTKIQALDHIALTVPNIDEATKFFEQAFDAKIAVEGLRTNEPPIAGPMAEAAFGMLPGGRVTARRVLKLNADTNIELFQFAGMPQRSAANTYDLGLQHFTVRVSDLQQTALDFMNAGGTLLQTPDYIEAVKAGTAPHQGWLYGRTPWGSIIEMVTFKEA